MKTVPEIQSAIRKAVQAGLNVLLEGDHGVGKSSILLGVARDLGLQMKSFSALVKTDLSIALRFVQLLPMMRPAQMNRVRDIVLALPDEMLAQLRVKAPFVFKRIREAAARDSGTADAAALGELLDERQAGVKV